MSDYKHPTEEIDLPSQGKIYPKDNPLSSGVIEMKYMTAREEDILTNQNYIKKGVVLDKLLQSLIINKEIKLDDMIVGDKNALLIAARVLGYGKEYEVSIEGSEYILDMSTLEHKEVDMNSIEEGKNEFSYTLPSSEIKITYQLLTGKLEKSVEREITGLKKINKEASPELTTRLKHMITSIEGSEDKKEIREFVDNQLLARDSRSFREHIKSTQPDINLSYILDNGKEVMVPIGLSFFWPDA